MSVRFGNFFTQNGKPGPALDIYDTQPGLAATPLLTSVAYGSVSAYVHPHMPANSLPGQVIATFYALPAGTNPVAGKADEQGLAGVQDDGSHPQVTLLLVSSGDSTLGSAPLAGLGVSTQVEKGDDDGSKGPAAAAPPSGQGQILVGTGPVTSLQTGSLGLYLTNGSSCTPPINGDTALPGVPLIFNSAASHSAFAIFPTAPGTHRVSVVAWTSDVAPTCAQLTHKQGATSITVTAGQQVEVYTYTGPR
jgi:hypothetical protein